MKRISPLYLVFLLIFVGCTNQNDEKHAEILSTFERTGILHNEGLDLFLAEFSQLQMEKFRAGGPGVLSYEEVMARTENSSERVFLQLDPSMQSVIPNLLSVYFDAEKTTTRAETAFDNGFTPFEQMILNEIYNVLESKTVTLDIFLAHISALENKIINLSPSKSERELLLHSTSVARYSAIYWNENYLNWFLQLRTELLEEILETRGDYIYPSEPLEPGTTIPHPHYKNLFYEADNGGLLWLKQCPPGLEYHTQLCRCDWPEDDSFDWYKLLEADLAGASTGAMGKTWQSAAGGAILGSAIAAVNQIF